MQLIEDLGLSVEDK